MKILIVDDNKENLYLSETILKGSGYEVASAANGAEALEKLRAERFDMIVSDILMPVMDGFQLCREVKGDEELKDIPFVFYTATYTDEKDEELALKMGADKFIRKPMEPDKFIETIKGVIRDAEKGKVEPAKPVLEEEKEAFKLYSERLVKKLENKMLDLEREITERKRVEDELQESEERYRNLIESAYDIIQSVATDGHFIFVNRAWLKTLGYTEAELQSLNLWKIIHPESLSHCQEMFSKVMAGESVSNVQATFVAKDGRSILVEGNVTGRYIGGKLIATHGFFHDITERKKAEEERKQSAEKLLNAMQGAIQAMAMTVEIRDPYTAGHQQRVTKLALAIAKEMGLPEEQVDGIGMAGIVHDIGKIYVPAEILSKPGRLTEPEFSMIKIHPQAGYDILKTVEFPWPIAQIVLQHHERMDGSGYPSGISGEDILLEARILGVADVVEAMASHRPYRPALGIDKALEEISQNRGVLYDPEVVDACLKLFAEKGFNFE